MKSLLLKNDYLKLVKSGQINIIQEPVHSGVNQLPHQEVEFTGLRRVPLPDGGQATCAVFHHGKRKLPYAGLPFKPTQILAVKEGFWTTASDLTKANWKNSMISAPQEADRLQYEYIDAPFMPTQMARTFVKVLDVDCHFVAFDGDLVYLNGIIYTAEQAQDEYKAFGLWVFRAKISWNEKSI